MILKLEYLYYIDIIQYIPLSNDNNTYVTTQLQNKFKKQ